MSQRKELAVIPTAKIYYDNAFNSRQVFTPQSCLELSESLRNHGLKFPVEIQPRSDVATLIPAQYDYRLVCGHRRFTAATKLLHWATIDVVIRYGLSEDEAKLLNLLENLERKNLNLYEEALALRRLFKSGTSMGHMGRALQKSTEWCRIRWKLFDLPEKYQKKVQEGVLTAYDLQCILVEGDAERMAIADAILTARKLGRSVTAARHKKRRRSRSRREIHNMVTNLMVKGLLPSPYAVLTWAAGDITDQEMMDSEL